MNRLSNRRGLGRALKVIDEALQLLIPAFQEVAEREERQVVEAGNARSSFRPHPSRFLASDAPLEAIQSFLCNTLAQIYIGNLSKKQRKIWNCRAAGQEDRDDRKLPPDQLGQGGPHLKILPGTEAVPSYEDC